MSKAKEGKEDVFSTMPAAQYEKAWFYQSDSPYQDFLLKNFVELIATSSSITTLASVPDGRLSTAPTIIDLGAGSCNFSAKLSKALNEPVLCIEPSAALLQQAEDTAENANPLLAKVCAGAEEFLDEALASSATEQNYNVRTAILKEVVHLIADDYDHDDLVNFFGKLRRFLVTRGVDDMAGQDASKSSSIHSMQEIKTHPAHPARRAKVIIMTRPATCAHFPLWPAVNAKWAKGQNHSYVRALMEAGFGSEPVADCGSAPGTVANDPGAAAAARGEERESSSTATGGVEVQRRSFPVEMRKSQWCGMVKSRFWSVLSGFTDVEVERALAEEVEWKKFVVSDGSDELDPMLRFEDQLLFIVATA